MILILILRTKFQKILILILNENLILSHVWLCLLSGLVVGRLWHIKNLLLKTTSSFWRKRNWAPPAYCIIILYTIKRGEKAKYFCGLQLSFKDLFRFDNELTILVYQHTYTQTAVAGMLYWYYYHKMRQYNVMINKGWELCPIKTYTTDAEVL